MTSSGVRIRRSSPPQLSMPTIISIAQRTTLAIMAV